jgi:hypothetical protein
MTGPGIYSAAMRDAELKSLSLLSWTLQIWNDHRLGVSQAGQFAAISYCMQHHQEWWKDWESAKESGENAAISTRLSHIHNDAAIKAQVDRGDPPEIRALYSALRANGFSEFDSIHTIALALMDENEWVREYEDAFSRERYIERAKCYAKEALSSPNLKRFA